MARPIHAGHLRQYLSSPALGVHPDERVFLPGRHQLLRDRRRRSIYDLYNAAANVTITVLNSSNTVVKTIQTNVSEQTGFQRPAWDGTNDQDAVVPDGTYTVDIAASNADGQASLTYTRQVASGTPGQLTTPTNGATSKVSRSLRSCRTAHSDDLQDQAKCPSASQPTAASLPTTQVPAGAGGRANSREASQTDRPPLSPPSTSRIRSGGHTNGWDSPRRSPSTRQPCLLRLRYLRTWAKPRLVTTLRIHGVRSDRGHSGLHGRLWGSIEPQRSVRMPIPSIRFPFNTPTPARARTR